MKKLVILLFAGAMTLTASAQQENNAATEPAQKQLKAYYDSKVSDNWYIGANLGVSFKTTQVAVMQSLNTMFGIRVGRWLTPVFGLAGELGLNFANKGVDGNKHFNGIGYNTIAKSDLNLLTTWNCSNLFGGYKGEPRLFEVIPVAGIGWSHCWQPGLDFGDPESDYFNTKLGIDFTFNLGSQKQWQLYIEPALLYTIADGNSDMDVRPEGGSKPLNLNINKSQFQLSVGFNYKFRNSNGTHNFKFAPLRDQSEIDALNGKINDLRNENDRLKKALTDCENKPVPVPVPVPAPAPVVKKDPMQTNLMPKVIFRLDKYVVDASQVANVDMIATYMKKNPEARVFIKGYASMEGNIEHNMELSNNRAQAVYDMLVKKFGISPSRLSLEGCGPTSEMSDILEFNRVATFEDLNKK